jgi:SNF2 family DNA or RNA helicase
MFDEFQKADNPRILTGTYGTMGEGATLTRAFRCILLDPDWEISKENQAIGRIHRCGQRHPTTSIRVYCQESFDEKIIAHQNTGKELNEHALGLPAREDASDPVELEAVLNRFGTQREPMTWGGSSQ